MSSLVYLLVWSPPPHIPYISSSNQCLPFRSTCSYHRSLFCCSINIISSIPSLSLNSLLGTLSFTFTLHIHLTILISARWSATSFSLLTGQVSLLCSILLCTQLLYSLPLLINGISLSVSNGTNCMNLFHPFEFWLHSRISSWLTQLHNYHPNTATRLIGQPQPQSGYGYMLHSIGLVNSCYRK